MNKFTELAKFLEDNQGEITSCVTTHDTYGSEEGYSETNVIDPAKLFSKIAEFGYLQDGFRRPTSMLSYKQNKSPTSIMIMRTKVTSDEHVMIVASHILKSYNLLVLKSDENDNFQDLIRPFNGALINEPYGYKLMLGNFDSKPAVLILNEEGIATFAFAL